MKHQVGFLFLAALALAPAGLAAQYSLVRVTIDSGTLIRMHPPTGAAIRGRLVQPLGPTSTLVQVCRYPAPPCNTKSDSSAFQRIPTASLVRIDVQQGSRWATGAVIGGVVGGVLGGLLGAFVNGMCEDSAGCGASTAVYALVGAVGFGAFGTLIGSGSPKWRPAP